MRLIENEIRWVDETLNIPYPWYTSPCLKVIEQWDFKYKLVFEFGVGDSTEWFRRRGAIYDGVDNNLEWAMKLGTKAAYYREEYLGSMSFGKLYDVIVIDGAWRDECTEKALKHLKPGGCIIIDNYKQESADLPHWPLTEKLIEGLKVEYYKEPEHDDWVTIIVRK